MIPVGVTSYRIHEHPRLLELTRACLRSALNQEGCDVRVILHDQCSDNAVITRIWNEFPSIALRHEPTPGLARAWNHLCQLVFPNHPLILLLNNDIELLPGSLKALMEFEAENKGKLIYGDTYTFSAFLLPREVYEHVGPFDEWYRGPTIEDWDYMKRLSNAGVPVVRCPGFKVRHEERATRKYVKDEWEELDRRSEAHFWEVTGVKVKG